MQKKWMRIVWNYKKYIKGGEYWENIQRKELIELQKNLMEGEFHFEVLQSNI